MPTTNCLVELVEPPFSVTTLNEIEVVNFERVGFNLKNFDMAIIFKDFTRDILRIDAIPSSRCLAARVLPLSIHSGSRALFAICLCLNYKTPPSRVRRQS